MKQGSPEFNPYAERGESNRKVLLRDRKPSLFRSLELRSRTAVNRIAVSPMCQYCATAGIPDDWHFQHLASRAVGGAGIVFTEATAISPDGRATPHCLGIWSDEQRDAFSRIVRFIQSQGTLAGIQLVHSGRKASLAHPASGGGSLPHAQGGWQTIAPSPIPFKEDHQVPLEMDKRAIEETIGQFAEAARRARQAGFDVLEIHGAHGYLIHGFLSPISNFRSDEYGGGFENRIRFLLEVIDAVRTEWPEDLPLFLRISASDWIDGGWSIHDSVNLAKRLREDGKIDLIDCSSGGASPEQKIKVFPGYQSDFAREVRKESGMLTGAVGLISTGELAESILASGIADLVFVGRAMLIDPYWPKRAAKSLRADYTWPLQYERGDVY